MRASFFRGARDGVPICLGYVSVAFVFGMMCVESGLSPLMAALISMANLTSAGQFAGLTLLLSNAPLFEIGITTLVINLRYTLMSLSLSQKVDARMTTLQRALLSFGNTDEVFAVCMQQKGPVTAPYLAGLVLCVYAGWAGGTILGATVAGALPEMVRSALGLAIYGMFLAIIIPAMRKEHPILVVVCVAVLLSCIIHFVPVFSFITDGFSIIICAVAASAVGALLYPVSEEEEAEHAA